MLNSCGLFAYGSATLMRGKSLTCRKVFLKQSRSMTVRVGEPLKKARRGRQVVDLPRIGVAEPSQR